jgi:photosystem II stability/assembly factor-like uncharacterized protein
MDSLAFPAGNSAKLQTIATDPHDSGRLYAGGPGIFRSDDYGATWHTLSLELQPDRLVVDPSRADRLYAIVGGLLWRSDDAGTTWTAISGAPADIRSFLVDAAGSLFLIGSGGVFRSSDAGKDWVAIPGPRAGAITFVASADPTVPGVIYAIGPLMSGFEEAVYKTVNGGETWIGPILTTRLLEQIDEIAVSSTLPVTVYAGRNFHERAISIGEVLASQDGGASWTSVFSNVDIRAIVPDPSRPNTLYVSVPQYALYSTTTVGVYRAKLGEASEIQGQRGIAPSQLVVSPDGSRLYAIDESLHLATLLLASPARRERSLPFR